MDAFDLLKVFGAIRDEYILSAHAPRQKKRLPAKRALLIAAIISVLLLLAGCAVVVLMGLKDAQLGNYTYDIGFGETQAGDAISLQGFSGSPEYQAAQEWQDFLYGYDTDGSILAAIGNQPTGVDAKYQLYTAYTQDMADELDRICLKYGLTLHTQLDILESQEDFFRRVGGDFLKENILAYAGYIYDDGTFQFDGDAQVEGDFITIQFRRAVKGSFDDVFLNLQNISLYQESHSTTPTGDDLVLGVGPEHGVILGDLGDCFLSINVLPSHGQTITVGLLEEIANGFDFAILKNVVKPEMDESLPTEPPETVPKFEGTDAQGRAYRDALQTLSTSYTLPGGYQVGYDGMEELSSNKFAIYDIDGDGSQELIIVYGTTSNAGNTFAIYDYDEATDTLKEELVEYISVSVDESGYLFAQASHAHGLGSGEVLWPYTLYRYEPATDAYAQVAYVDTWEKQYYPQDYNGNPFPDAADEDGDGVVYLLSFSDTEAPEILDTAAFQSWEKGYRTAELSLPWVSLTLPNMEALGKQNFLPGVSIKGLAPTADGFTAGVELLIKVEEVLSGKAGYQALLEQNPDTPRGGSGVYCHHHDHLLHQRRTARPALF